MPCQCTHDHPDPLKRLAVYSRIVGYYEPFQQWNKAKQAEFRNRKTYKMGTAIFKGKKPEGKK